MEILHDGASKRTVLVALEYSANSDMFLSYLAHDFRVLRADDADECLEIMHKRLTGLSAVIIDVDMAQAHDYAFLRKMREEPRFATIPAIVATLHEPTEADLRCLDEGATEMLTKPYRPAITKRRIENAIQLKRSTTFYEIEAMLRELPSNIFLKDTECRYVFCTHYWHHLDMGDDPNWTIRGKTDLEIRKDRENAIKAMEVDKEILRTGKGTSYVIEINVDGVQEFMELIKRPVHDEDGNITGIIALINDVTETELLKRELEQRARTDELTQLNNHRAFDEYVSKIPSMDEFPIAVISADCDGLKKVNDTFGHLLGDEYIRMAATALKSAIPEKATAFRTGGDEFVAFLPGCTQAQADAVVAEMQAQSRLFKIMEQDVGISYGTSVIENAKDNAVTAIARADRAMYANKARRKRAR